MWLYIPETDAQKSRLLASSPGPGCSTSELNLHSARSSTASLTWNAKPTLLRSLQRRWSKGGFVRRLSGLTLEPFAAHNSAITFAMRRRTELEHSSPVTHAPISPSPARELVCAALRDRFGGPSLQRLQSMNPSCSFSKMSEATLLPGSIPFSVRFDTWVTGLRADCLRRQKRAQATNGSDCSSWPTATKMDANGARNRTVDRGAESNHHDGETLNDAIRNWPTPHAADPQKDRGSDELMKRHADRLHASFDLPVEARNWSTPRAQDAESAGSKNKGDFLTNQAMLFPTPAARDWRTPNSEESQDRRKEKMGASGQQLQNYVEHHCQSIRPGLDNSTSGGEYSTSPPNSNRPSLRTEMQCLLTQDGPIDFSLLASIVERVGRPAARRLNTLFVEWLMGWPTGHTACDVAEMEWSRWKLRMRSYLSLLIYSVTKNSEQGILI